MNSALLLSFLAASLLVVVAPGPATLFVLRRCERSLGEPFKGVAGIVVGDIVMIGLSGLGVAALLMRNPGIASALQLVGAAYVGWLGWSTLRTRAEPATPTAKAAPGGSFVQGLLLTLSNPKPLLFFAAFFPLFINAAAPAGPQFVRLGALFEAVNLAFYAIFIATARLMLGRLPRRGAIVGAVSGVGLLSVAILGGGATLVELAR